MRADDGTEIIEPGDYVLEDGRTLRVYLTEDENTERQMWACTHCQEVDGITNGLLVGVIDGHFDIAQDETGQLLLKLTQAGEDAAKALIRKYAEESDQ